MISRKRWLAVATAAVTSGAVTSAALVAGPASASSPHAGHLADRADASGDRVASAYFADWDAYGRGYEVADIPADNLNTIQYAFGKPVIDPVTHAVTCGAVDPWADYERTPVRDDNAAVTVPKLNGNFAQLLKLKAKQAAKGKDLTVMLSIGGWSLSNGFSQAAATAATRAAFVSSCIDSGTLAANLFEH